MIDNSKWKWLVEAPLSAKWRSRLELGLGAVLSAAAVVALSSSIRPDAAKIAVMHHQMPLVSSVRTVAGDYPETPRRPTMTPDFYEAIQHGDVAGMAKHYEKGIPLEGMLSVAAHSGKKGAVLWLLDHGASIHDSESSDSAPLLTADEFPDIAKLLSERGAEEPSLDNAARANAANAVQRLLAKNPNVNAKFAYVVEAAASATAGTAENKRLILKLLLERGADPNRATGEGALAAAIGTCEGSSETEVLASDCLNIVQLLLDHGAHLTGEALGAALSLDDATKRSTLVDTFLAMPIEPGVTAVALAKASSVQPADLKRIVAKKVDWAWNDGEENAALPALAAVRRTDRDQLRAYLDAGAPVDVHFKDGSSALGEAIDGAAYNDEDARIVELLVTRGANVNRRLPDGRTPLFAAAESGSLRVVNFLLDHGARVNELVLDDTAIDAAESNGHQPVARVLHAHGGHRAHPHMW